MYSLEDKPKSYIEIGSYGGFSGQEQVYYFFPNGQRFFTTGFMGDSTSKVTALESAFDDQFEIMIAELYAMEFFDYESTPPGNMTYYIKFQEKKKVTKVVWNNMDTAPQNLVSFYRKYTQNFGNLEE